MTAPHKSQLPETLDDWLCYLDNLHSKEIDLGLSRIGKVFDYLGLSVLSSRVILLAGTNGKGTTSRFLEAYLHNLGYSVGVFNSPQLHHYNERVRINKALLTDDVHVSAFNHIEQHRGQISLTSFEFSTLAALKIFADNTLDFVIMEVGMGGRLDSTNIVNPEISVITTIDIDHQAFLGNDRMTIGYEKAGIFRADKPAVVGDFDIPDSVLEHGRKLGSHLVCANRDFSLTEYDEHWRWQSGQLNLKQLILPSIPLQNVSTALATLQQLKIDLNRTAINKVLGELVVEGRLQQISQTPLIIVDVAHNPQSSLYLAGQLAKYKTQGYSSISAVVGILKDKDIDQVLANVSDQISRWYLSDLTTPRGAKAIELAQSLEKRQISPYTCYDCVAKGLAQAKSELPDDGLIIVFGSFYTVAEAVQYS